MKYNAFAIFGERCSGTNFLQKSIIDNFNLCFINCQKHFFNGNIHNDTEHIVFCIVRNPIDYLASFFRTPHHQPIERTKNFIAFISSEFWSVNKKKEEMMVDRNFEANGRRYIDIFEMRSVKCKFLFSTVPLLVSNSCFIRYEDLKLNPIKILEDIEQKYGLQRKEKKFYIEKRRIRDDQSVDDIDPIRENYVIEDERAKEIIKTRLDFDVETLIGYDKTAIMERLM